MSSSIRIEASEARVRVCRRRRRSSVTPRWSGCSWLTEVVDVEAVERATTAGRLDEEGSSERMNARGVEDASGWSRLCVF